jgi:signal transduction histidine kinase/ActR/RegA family two-component response regulator/HAMP domain-containing protein
MKIPAGIRARLLLLAATCTLPVYGLLLYDEWRSSEEQLETARMNLRVRAEAEAAELDRDMRSASLLLKSMTQIPAVADVESSSCSKQLVVLAAPYSQIGNAFGIRLDGLIACRTTPGSTVINVIDRDYFKKALASNEPVIGEPIESRTTDRYVLPIALAVRNPDGKPTAVLMANVNLSQYALNTAAGWTDEGTAIAWWDREARIVFRWPNPKDWIGQSFADTPFGKGLLGKATGHFEALGADGVARVHGFATVGATGMKLSFSVPRNVLVAPHREALIRNTLLLTVITLAGWAAAWMLGEILIRRPLTTLARITERMGGGDLEARCKKPYSRDEVGIVARSFDAMAETLAAQITALRNNEDQLRENLSRAEKAEQRIRQQLEHMNLLDQITCSIGARLDLQSTFQVVVRTLEDSLPVDLCCIALHDPQSNTLRVERVGNKSGVLAQQLAMAERASISVDNNGLGRCITGQLVYEPDISQVRFPFPERLFSGGLRSLVMAPLRSESRVFGVLVAARCQANSFTSIECEFLRQVSEHVALAAGQAQLHGALQLAYDDLRQTQQVVMQEERLRALGQMASGIAHDINNALSPVSLYTESLLETEKGLSDRARGYLETILRAVEDVAQTVARMREFYRQREVQLALAPVDVNRLVQQVLDLTRARWKDMSLRKGIVIRTLTEFAPELSNIMGVESEIREALINLVFNAVDAMPDGGTLTLRTRPRPSGSSERGAVAIEVQDEGVGMDEDTRRRCIEPFFTTKGERGTGLGLAMVFGTVQRHSAELEIDSVPGVGTTFRLVFAVPTVVTAESGQSAKVLEAPSRLRLLVIDDDPVLLKSLREALEADGHVIVDANGGKEGLSVFRASLDRGENFAAVLTDLGMPHVDGRMVAAEVKETSPSTPVILLTGWGQRLIAEDDIPPYVDRVLSKPPKLREVREVLADLCKSGVK